MIQLRNLLFLGARWQAALVFLSILMIVGHLFLKIMSYPPLGTIQIENIPLLFIIFSGGVPLMGLILLLTI